MLIAPILGADGSPAWFLGSQVDVSDPGDAPLAIRQQRARGLIDALSPRQRQVLGEMARGYRNKQIAWRLSLSEKTVKMHRGLMLGKLGSHVLRRRDPPRGRGRALAARIRYKVRVHSGAAGSYLGVTPTDPPEEFCHMKLSMTAALALGLAPLAACTTMADGTSEQTAFVGGAEMFPSRNIVENAVNSPIHTTLVAAVKAAGLVDTLAGPGPFTVFAPTDAAFKKLPAGTVETLLQPANRGQLQSVLTYHVVPGRVTASQLIEHDQGRRRHARG